MACKKGQFYVAELMMNNQFKDFSINFNVPHVIGLTHFDLKKPCTVIGYSRVPPVAYP